MNPLTLDHVALWVADRDAIADFATRHLAMHVIDRSDAFTLVGSDARRGKLTLFTADGPRARGALKHVALRVADLDAALERLSHEVEPETDGGSVLFDLAEGLRLALVEAPTDVDYDLDHVALFTRDPHRTATDYVGLGFEPAATGAAGAPRVAVGGAHVEFHLGDPEAGDRPLLNHLAVLVGSAEEHRAEAERRGLEIADFVDAPNTLALFLSGPDGVRVEYVEHKPSFALT